MYWQKKRPIGDFKGHTKNYLCVTIKGVKENIRNKIVQVVIEKEDKNVLIGRTKCL